jgi:HPt (histidine-containing phosphotransfer) domain-containing protein
MSLDAARQHGNPKGPPLSNVVNGFFTIAVEIPRPSRLRARWKRFGRPRLARSAIFRDRISMSSAADRRLLDLTHLARQTFGDRALEREVLALFEQQCVRLLPLIVAGEDLTERADAAHTLKGAARAVGAWRIASLAGTLEEALDDGRAAETLARLDGKLEKAIAETRAALAERWRNAAA